MIIDFHVHTFPEKVAARALPALAATSMQTPATDGTINGLKDAMEADGVDMSVMQPIATNVRQVTKLNDAAIANNALPDFMSFGAMHPAFEDMETELDRIASAGIKGIKLHPDFQHFFLDDERCVRLMNLCAERGLIVLIHGGLDISYPEINKSTPERLAAILPHVGDAIIVFAHLGGYGYFDDAIRYLTDTDVYVDTAAMDVFPDELTLKAVKAFGAGRVLFGSDSPWSRQKDCIAMINRLGLSQAEKDAVLGGNAKRLLDI